MLNVQTLGILLRALRDGNARPDALRAPAAVAGVARVAPVAADANESLRGDAPIRTLPALRTMLPALAADERELSTSQPDRTDSHPASDARMAPRESRAADGALAPQAIPRGVDSGTASAALALSATGRWLTGVQGRTADAAAATVARARTPPLVADPAVPAPALAAALETAVTTSGVFYESHLARWVRDEFALASLAREPQAAWTPATRAETTPPVAASLPQDTEKLAVVSRQLEVLDAKTVTWSGAAWPDQQASIEIREDERSARRDEGDVDKPSSAWRTRIALTLPSLGEVEATLALRGDTLELRLVATDPAQARLAGAHDELAHALAARSLDLAAFSIGHADER